MTAAVRPDGTAVTSANADQPASAESVTACREHGGSRHLGSWWWLGPLAAAAITLILTFRIGGVGSVSRITGLPDAGPFVAWALPILKTTANLAGTFTIGLCVTAAFSVPGDDTDRSSIGPSAYRLLRLTTWTAAVWTAATIALGVVNVADLLGQPLSFVTPAVVTSYATSIPQGQALLIEACLALLVAILSRLIMSRGWAAFIAIVAIVGILPPTFTGHAASAGNHQIAVTSLAMHVLAATLWVGGLAALVVLRPTRQRPDAAARFSRLALVCAITVAATGAANAWVRLGTWDQLWRSPYGALVVAKLLALLALGAMGALHRRRTLAQLRSGSPGAFMRLAVGEAVVFTATMTLAVVLSRTPTPVPTNPSEFDPYTDQVGFSMPDKLSVAGLFGPPLPDLFFLTAVFIGIFLYINGVSRLRRAGHAWPLGRTVSFVSGMLILGIVTNLGVARYAYVMFSVHMAQHMMLTMVVPILLIGGAPVTLALRAIRRSPDRSVRGPREWLLIFVHSRYVKVISHPVVALIFYVISLYAVYFSDLMPVLMRYHLGHLAMVTHFVASGALFFWVLIGIDPGRRRLAPPILILVHFAAMVFHAFFGVALLQSQRIIAADWFSAVHPLWASSLLSDQRLGAGIAWAFGELPAAVVMAILVRQWIRSDEREQQRLDRAAARADADGIEDELARYNEFLRQASAQATRHSSTR